MGSFFKSSIIITVCLCFVFSIVVKGEAGNLTPGTVSPNPFDPNTEQTTISYTLGYNALLWLKIYDFDGVLVRDLVSPSNNYTENKTSGSNSDNWDGKDDGSSIVEDSPYTHRIDDIGWRKTVNSPGSLTNTVTDVAANPSNSQILYLANNNSNGSIYRSINGGDSWESGIGWLGTVRGIAISNNGQYVYALTSSKILYYSNNYGVSGSWTAYPSLWASADLPLDVACSNDGKILYGVDTGTKKVYKSENYGATWNSGFPSGGSGPRGIAVDPNDSDHILVADGRKVYESTDGGINFVTVLDSINVYQVSIDNNGYFWTSEIPIDTYTNRCRVSQWDSNGNLYMRVGPDNAWGDDKYVFNCSSSGILGIYATSHAGEQYLYVADYQNRKVKKYLYDNYVSPSYIIVNADHDSTPPAPINDLVTGNVGSDSVNLGWTAPGDDGNTPGTKAKFYDVRYSKAPITNDTEFSAATQSTGEPYPPSIQGTTENFAVTGLPESNTMYYFAMKSTDDVLNTSGLSNSPYGKTGLLYGWNMVSCPKQPSPNDSYSVFGVDAWGWNCPTCIYYWNSTWTGSGNPDAAGYWSNAATVVPGRGLFLYSLFSNPTDAAGTNITDATYTIPLSAGWNVIGNPYGTNVNLSSCNVTKSGVTKTYEQALNEHPAWIGNAVYIWNGITYIDYPWDSAKLEPWKSYWIMSYYDLDLIINKP